MSPKPRLILRSEDDLAWEKRDETFDEWEKTIHNKSTYHATSSFILKYRPGEAVKLHQPILVGYSMFYRLEYKVGSATLRVPCNGVDSLL